MIPTTTTTQAMVTPSELSRQRRTLASVPMYVSVSRARRYDVRRALPRFCRSRISASPTRRSLAIVRRAGLISDGVRGSSPTNALVEAHASPSAPGEQPDDQLDDGQHGDLQGPQRQPAACR